MKNLPGWKYIYSETLKQNIALHEKTGWLYCEDGTKYSPRELQILNEKKAACPKIVHDIKKEFGGTIVKQKD